MKAAVYQMNSNKLEPLFPGEAQVRDLRFMPNLTIEKGRILGQVSAASANEIQKLDFSGTWAAGDTFTLSIVGVDGKTYTTGALELNSTPAYPNASLKTAIETMLEAAGYEGATVTIGSGPAPADVTVTFGGTAAAFDMPLMSVAYETAGNGTVSVVLLTAGVTNGIWGPYCGDTLADPTVAPTAAELAGGSLPLLMQCLIAYTFTNSVGETLPSPATAVALTSTKQAIRVSAITLPSGATGVNYYINGFYAGTSDGSQTDITALPSTPSKPLPVVNTAYVTTDGRYVARAIAQYSFTTDSFGRVSPTGMLPARSQTAPAYIRGHFACEDLVGLDAKALGDLGRLVSGTISQGILSVV